MRIRIPTTIIPICSGIALIAIPESANALTLVQIVGLFHIVAGLLLTFTLGIFVTGTFLYFARLNTWPNYRDMAIRVLMWAVLMLFILILFVAFVQFVQQHSAVALSILGVIAVIAALILIAKVMGGGKKKAPEKGGRPSGPPGGAH